MSSVAIVIVVVLLAVVIVWLALRTSQGHGKNEALESQVAELRRELQTIATSQAQSAGQIQTIGQTVNHRLVSVTQALQAAGPDPTRGSVLQQLRQITSFSGGYLIGTANPAKKIPSNCYIIGQVEGGRVQRLDDPPINGPTHGYRCDEPFFYVGSSS